MHPCNKHIFYETAKIGQAWYASTVFDVNWDPRDLKNQPKFPNSDTLIDIRILLYAKDSRGVLCL